MSKYYKIKVFYFDKYDIDGEDKVYYTKGNIEEIIAEKVLNGYKEIVTNEIIQEKSILDVDGTRLLETTLGLFLGTRITKKGITNEIRKKSFIIGVDTKIFPPEEIINLDEIKKYIDEYKLNKFSQMLQKIQILKHQQTNNKMYNKKVANSLVTEKNVKKLVKDYKYGKEE